MSKNKEILQSSKKIEIQNLLNPPDLTTDSKDSETLEEAIERTRENPWDENFLLNYLNQDATSLDPATPNSPTPSSPISNSITSSSPKPNSPIPSSITSISRTPSFSSAR
jgi:hypothetical protein